MLLGLPAAAAAESCTLPAVADQVDLKPLAASNLMTVPVEINGKPKQFLLAISGNPTEISQAAVTDLALPENGKTVTSLEYGGGDIMATAGSGMSVAVVDVRHNTGRDSARARVNIDSFKIGDATTRHMQFLVAYDKEMGKSEPYDGLMTGNFFRQYDVELDFAGKQINYLTPTKCSDPDQVVFWSHGAVAVIPMNLQDGKIHTQVSVLGHVIDAVVDTSAARTVMRRDVAELILGYKPDTPDLMPAADLKDAMGQQVYGHTFSLVSFAGGVAAQNVPALIQTTGMVRDPGMDPVLGSRAQSSDPRIPDLTLGMDVLHQLHLYVVFGQKKLYVTAPQ
jgi:predicted aspartyl protease